MTHLQLSSKRRGSGFTLVEVSIVVAVTMLLAAYKLREAQMELTADLGRAQGQQLKALNDGLYDYGFKNFQAIVNNTAVTGVANTRAPTIAELIAKGNLKAGFNTTPYVGGGYGLSIDKYPAACVTNCNISGLVWLQNPVTTNGGVNGPLLGSALNAIGADGGYSRTAGNISGYNGGWTVTNPVAGTPAGILAARNGAGTSLDMTNYLNRDGSLPMTGNLNMSGSSITGVKQAAVGTACASTGELVMDPTGSVLSCQGGSYQSQSSAYWKEPVASFAALPACSVTTTGQTRAVYNPSVGTGMRAYTCNGAGSWNAVAVDNNGILTAVKVNANTLQVNTVASEGGACTNVGEVARDGNGMSLSCIDGAWRKQDFCKAYAGDLNGLQTSGCYNGAGLGNAPTTDWFFVEVMRHYNTGNYYTIQRATGMTGTAANKSWTRSQQSGASSTGWGGWTVSGSIGKQLASNALDYNGSRTVDHDPIYYYYWRYFHYVISGNGVYLYNPMTGAYQGKCTLSGATGSCETTHSNSTCGSVYTYVEVYQKYTPTVNGLMAESYGCDYSSRIVAWQS